MRGEGRVVAAAVVGVQYERYIQNLGFKIGKFAVFAQYVQDVLRRRIFRLGFVNDERTVVCVVVTVCPVGIDGEHRELCYQLDALTQHVGNAYVVGVGIVAV